MQLKGYKILVILVMSLSFMGQGLASSFVAEPSILQNHTMMAEMQHHEVNDPEMECCAIDIDCLLKCSLSGVSILPELFYPSDKIHMSQKVSDHTISLLSKSESSIDHPPSFY